MAQNNLSAQGNEFPGPSSFEECQELFNNAPIGIFTSTPDGRFISVNPAMARIFGYDSPNEMIESITDIAQEYYIDPFDREEFVRQMHEQDMVVNHECRVRRRDGSIIWVSRNAREVRDKNDKITHYQGFVTDITDRKQAENALVESESLFRGMFMDHSAVMLLIDPKSGQIIRANKAAAQYYGYPLDKMLQMKIQQLNLLSPTEVAEKMQCALKKMVNTFEFQHLLQDGQVCDVEVHSTPVTIQKQKLLFSIIHDITDRKQAEKALRESEEKYRTVFENTGSATCILEKDGTISLANVKFAELAGYPIEEIQNKKNWKEFVVREDLESMRQQHDLRREDRKKAFNEYEFRFIDKAHNIKNIYLCIDLIPDTDKSVASLLDITGIKRSEKEIMDRERLLESIIDGVSDLLAIQYPDHSIERYNQAGYDLLRMTPEEVKGKKCFELLGRDCECEKCATRIALETGKLEHVEKYVPELDIYLDCRSNPVLDENGSVVQIVEQLRDISERKKYEEQLKYLSLHDQLTGLYNRAYLENELQRLQHSRDFPISIICMDLDGLKLVNDTLGHDHGDTHLRDCAQLLQESFRAADIVARFGGDEFVALLPRTNQKAGEKLIDRIRSRIDEFNQEKSREIPLSLSIGVACAKESNGDLLDVFKQADDLMYRDKLHRDITSRSQIMKGLMAALEERDFITSGHAHRLEDLCFNLGREMGLSASQLSDLNLLAQVHDLGKVGIPDYILFKPGPLSEEEWQIMRQHPEKGYRIAQSTTDLAGISELVLKHHERWDGKGYPLKLKGEEIPIECRILAIVDAFDSMTNDRPYRKAMPVAEVQEELQRCAGSQFDPQLVPIFLQMMSELAL